MANGTYMQPETGYETFEAEQFEFTFENGAAHHEAGAGSPFSEAEEMELAAELLGISTEAELDRFLGGLIGRGVRAVGGFLRSPTGQALGGMLRGAAKQALPMLGRAVGGRFGGPAGASIGGQLASTLGGLFGLELEGLSQEDQEFELARQFVRLAGAAASNAANASPSVPPAAAAKAAMTAAAQQFAPGLLQTGTAGVAGAAGRGRSGQWIRRGRVIIVLGV